MQEMTNHNDMPPMGRRGFLAALAAGVSVSMAGVSRSVAQDSPPAAAAGAYPLDHGDVVEAARRLSAAPHQPLTSQLNAPFADLGYDAYRAIRSRSIPIGRGQDGFALDLLPPGFIYKDRVAVSLATSTAAIEFPFAMDRFEFDPSHFDRAAELSSMPAPEGAGYSGFRLRYPINRVDVSDEFAVFQGASYFRAIARNMIYGLSARGLAIRTGDARGEEFPAFRQFWIEEPRPGARAIVVRALLDSASCAGAFEFEITPGETTVMQIRCTLFPRVEIAQIGLAPLTSMFLFGSAGPVMIDDYRDAVHDSEGLQMITGQGERLWRPLLNPRQFQISAFQDTGPKGFGLTQRRRDFAHYQDDEARYDRRPSAWIEPLDNWGRGAVILVEIPIRQEFNDNIVAFWRPEQPLQPSEAGHEFSYRLHWCAEPPDAAPLGRVVATRSGASIHSDRRRVLAIDFAKESPWAEPLSVEANVSRGELTGVTLRELPGGKLRRVSFEFEPVGADLLEFNVVLTGPNGPESEKWLYRWTPA